MGIVSTLLARCLAQNTVDMPASRAALIPHLSLPAHQAKQLRPPRKTHGGGGGERRRGSRGDPVAHLVAEEQRRIELCCDILQQPPRGGPRGRGGAAAPPRMRAYWLCAPLMPTALACRWCARQR